MTSLQTVRSLDRTAAIEVASGAGLNILESKLTADRISVLMFRALSLIIVAGCGSSQEKLGSAPPPSKQEIDAFIQGEWKQLGSPGMSVAIVKSGKLVYAKGFGFADIGHSVVATPSTVYRIGSLTKQFTATMIMQLIQEGKLTFDTSLISCLPTVPAAWGSVTIRQLLNHTAGIPNFTEDPNYLKLIEQDVTPEHILDRVVTKPLDFAPGTNWKYSNSGYVLLGLILEKADKKPYGSCLKSRILQPIGMTSTYFGTDENFLAQKAVGYTNVGPRYKVAPPINMVWPYAAGAIDTNVTDFAKWDAALYEDKLLKRSALEEMWTPTTLKNGQQHPYGFGWVVFQQNGIPAAEHAGGINGFTSYIFRAPSVGDTVIVLSNWDTKSPQVLGKHLAEFFDPALVEKTEAITDPTPDLTVKLKALLLDLLAGNVKKSAFSPEMLKVLTPELVDSMKSQADRWGSLQELTLIRSIDKEGENSREYLAKFEKSTWHASFIVGTTGLVESAVLRP